MSRLRALALAVLCAVAAAGPANALEPRPGWSVHASQKSYDAMIAALRAAVRDNGMAVVTAAGPTEAAAGRGVTIPGNRVLGVFRNDFAVRTLALSEAAMIEAPIRFYVTEQPDGTATLSFKRPSFVLAPYAADGGPALAEIGAELDAVFDAIAADALR